MKRGTQQRKAHRRRKHGVDGGSRGGHGYRRGGHKRPDWDDADHLETFQRHLEQRVADLSAKIDDVADRVKQLRETDAKT
jgi:hypothetical protein